MWAIVQVNLVEQSEEPMDTSNDAVPEQTTTQEDGPVNPDAPVVDVRF